MADLKLSPPILITQQTELQAMLDQLRGQTAIAVDTESDSLYVYKEKVCLIQISIPGTDYLIDPLAEIDLQPLGGVLADPKVQTVFHAAEYDVICLRRDYGFTFANLFDTMWAARILGWPRVGLGDILKEQFEITLDKRWQRHNWGKRPIEPAALAYARLDTHYLLRLRDVQLRELRRLDRLEEAQEVFADLAQSEGNGHEFTPNDFWRVKGMWDLEGRAQAILRQLVIWRDREAKRQDRPPFKVIGDRTLIDLAKQSPTALNALSKLNSLSAYQFKRYGSALLSAIKQGQADPIPTAPRRPAPDLEVLARYEQLRAWRKAAAAGRGVEPDVIVGNATLMEIARRQPRALNQLAGIDGLGPWRRRTYGPALLQALWNG
jgi:ribonuclease D